jgi:hypothetical protein
MKLSSNRELYDYLILLAGELENRGAHELAEGVRTASKTAPSIPTTEFLGESRIALRRVDQEGSQVLKEAERADLRDVLKQLNAAFDRRC